MDWHARSRRSGRPQRAALAGQAAVGITASVVARRRMFAGRADQARHARRFLQAALDGCPVADMVVLLADELVTNALVHTRSGDGGVFEVMVWSGPSSAWVAGLDGGS